MNISAVAQIAGLIVLYFGGIFGVGYFIANSVGKRIDDLGKRIDDFGKRIDDSGKRIDDLRSQMTREHDILAAKVDTLTEVVVKHVTDYSIHNKS